MRWRKSSVTFGSVLHYWLWLMWSEEITEIQYSHKSPLRLTAVSLSTSRVGHPAVIIATGTLRDFSVHFLSVNHLYSSHSSPGLLMYPNVLHEVWSTFQLILAKICPRLVDWTVLRPFRPLLYSNWKFTELSLFFAHRTSIFMPCKKVWFSMMHAKLLLRILLICHQDNAIQLAHIDEVLLN